MNSITLDVLTTNRLFQSLPKDAIETLASAARPVSIGSNALLFGKGDEPDAIYILNTGEIAIETISEHGKPVRVSTLHIGDMIGELGVLGGIPRTADARATSPSTLLRIDGAIFIAAVKNNPDFAMRFIENLIGRLSNTNNQIENISLRPLRVRIAIALLEKANNLPEGNRAIKLTQSALAEEVSATREKVNTHLQHIQRTGAVSLGRGNIEIVSLEKLKEAAQAE